MALELIPTLKETFGSRDAASLSNNAPDQDVLTEQAFGNES